MWEMIPGLDRPHLPLTDPPQQTFKQILSLGHLRQRMLYAGLLCVLERRRGLVTSGVQFIFWLLTSLSDIIPFYSGIIQKGHDDDIFRFSLLCLEFTVTIIMLVLQFFSEAQHRHGYQALGQEEVSPELYASFPSRLTFWWAQRLMSMGFKKSLESKDLFPMDPVNQSRNIVPPFRLAWQAEVDRVNNINSKISPKKASFTKSAHHKTDDEHTPLLNNHTEIHQTRRDAQRDSTSATHDPPSHTRRTAKQVVTNKDKEVTSENHKTRTINQPNQNGYGTLSTQGDVQGQSGEVSFKGQRRGQGHSATNGGTFPKVKKSKVELSASAPSEDDGKVHPSLFRVLVATYWLPFFIGQFLMLLYTLLQFVNPMVLNALLDYVNARDTSPEWQGYVLACSFFVASFTATFIFHQTQHNMMPLGMRVKSSIITAVYQKALTMSNESRRQSTVGEIVNLMSIDCQRLQDVTAFLYLTWSGPLTIAIALYQLWGILGPLTIAIALDQLWGILGPACLAGLGVMLLVIPVNLVVVSKQRKLQIATMRIKDQRLKLMAEVLNGIKVLKLYGWEPSFQDKVLYHRNRELDNLRKIAYLNACSVFVWTLVPYLVTLASFTAYILTSELGYLDSTKAFVSLSLFNLMRAPINQLPRVIPTVIQAGVSLTRVNKFLNWGDLDPDNVNKDPKAYDVIAIDEGTFIWDRAMPKPTLQSINMHIPEGKLVAVVGAVGCGKSSLLAAILGEMEKTKGTVTMKNTIAYVPQEAWIQNATVRDNITFGKPMSRRRYDQVVRACALESDFKILVGGDMTEIGEKGINLSGGQKQRVSVARAMYSDGINLSGGQKQRVSVARAVYSDADTYLLDDPLSAVDSHVGKHIFHNVISRQGVLASKWLPMVDQMIMLRGSTVSGVYTLLAVSRFTVSRFTVSRF
ncbi:multidrug resistance-associated protein 1-like [Littorina saxatilis]|uniref:multidrug resistance-associated protein 1-like n=1 Tax=Littorina saxatilis TaxID=31220 RepID=UPI0038B47929